MTMTLRALAYPYGICCEVIGLVAEEEGLAQTCMFWLQVSHTHRLLPALSTTALLRPWPT